MAADGLSPAHMGAAIIGGILILLVALAMYVLPTIVAMMRKHPQLAPIALVNIVLGWSFIGWIVALVWALTNPQPQQTVIIQQPPPQS